MIEEMDLTAKMTFLTRPFDSQVAFLPDIHNDAMLPQFHTSTKLSLIEQVVLTHKKNDVYSRS